MVPSRGSRQAMAAATPGHARTPEEGIAGPASFDVQNVDGRHFSITVKGRVRWALEQLLCAGAEGCTPLRNPAPRWSQYVMDLRHLEVVIETVRETHGGVYPGHHGRYVLRSAVTRVEGDPL